MKVAGAHGRTREPSRRAGAWLLMTGDRCTGKRCAARGKVLQLATQRRHLLEDGLWTLALGVHCRATRGHPVLTERSFTVQYLYIFEFWS